MATPRLADVKCSKIQFQPGDRILVRVFEPLSKEEMIRLKKTVEKWAGGVVEVLVFNCTKVDVQVERNGVITNG